MNNLKFRVVREFLYASDTLGLYFWGRTSDGKLIRPEPITSRVLDDEAFAATEPRGPDIPMSIESAQQLMDELWHVGLRPSEGTGSAGSLAATQSHLKDMRAIVSKTIGVELK